MTPAQRQALGLDEPSSASVAVDGEFMAAPQSLPGAAPGVRANPRLVDIATSGQPSSAPRVRAMVNDLLAGNIHHVDVALKQLLAANPKAGLELYRDLMAFSVPQLRAAAVVTNDATTGDTRALSFAQLQALLTGEG